MKKDFLFIVNPKAGKGKAGRFLPEIVKAISRSELDCDILITEKRGDAQKFSAGNFDKYKNYVAVGGDGTVNEIVNGFNRNEKIFPSFGVLPLGSGNDFGKALQGKRKAKEILRRYCSGNFVVSESDFSCAEIIEEGGEQREFLFINALGIGFDSFVAKENRDSKIFSGLTSYVFAVLRGLKKFNGVKAKVIVDGKQIANGESLLLVTVGNNKTSGGGFYLNPFAEINDGKLDVTTIAHLPIKGILRNLPLTLLNKTETVKGFTHHNGKEIRVELCEPFIVHADGEIFSVRAKEVKVRISNKKIKLIA